MLRFPSYIALLFALTACPAAPEDESQPTEGDGDTTNAPGRDDADPGAEPDADGENGDADGDPLPGDDTAGQDTAGDEDDTAEDPDGAVGGDGTPDTGGQPPELCALFHDEWAYEVVTYYEPGEDPIVADIWGNAHFRADGTYEQNYYIGGIGNFFSGDYVVEGDRLTTYDDAGEVVFEYRFTCGDELRELVLIIENDDGTPSLIYGLSSLAE